MSDNNKKDQNPEQNIPDKAQKKAKSEKKTMRRLWFNLTWILIAVFVIAADQITKFLAVRYLKPVGSVPCIPKLFDLTYAENRGAAFGMFSDMRWVHMSISTAAVIALTIFMALTRSRYPLLAVSAGMIIGGGTGNLIDRFFVGYVVDFIEPIFIDFAIFNTADSFVCIGAFILFIFAMRSGLFSNDDDDGGRKENKKKKKPEADSAADKVKSAGGESVK